MNRILVSSVGDGTFNYTFPVNPTFFDSQDSPEVYPIGVLHGGDIYQKSYFDGRPRTMLWKNQEVSDSDMVSLTTYLKSVEGEIRYFNFQDIESLENRWPNNAVGSDTDYKKARVISLRISYKEGGALHYNTVELVIQPEA